MTAGGHLAPPPPDPTSLTNFPASRLLPPRHLFRVHSLASDVFAAGEGNRFSLPRLPGVTRTTYCFATDPVVALREKCGETYVLPRSVVDGWRVSTVRLARPALLADCTDPRARLFGMTPLVHRTADHDLTRQWALALASVAFDGLLYRSVYDDSPDGILVALFGTPSSVGAVVRTEPAVHLCDAVYERFGVIFLDTTMDPGHDE